MLTWDDWGGYDDDVKTPVVEYTPDNAYGPRVPLLMFGELVKQTIDSRWCGHASVPRTAIDLLGLPALGVPRVDQAPGLVDLVDLSRKPIPAPPAYGAPIAVPPAPNPPVAPKPPPPYTTASPSLVARSSCATGARCRRPTTRRSRNSPIHRAAARRASLRAGASAMALGHRPAFAQFRVRHAAPARSASQSAAALCLPACTFSRACACASLVRPRASTSAPALRHLARRLCIRRGGDSQPALCRRSLSHGHLRRGRPVNCVGG
jgi:hypothetical protein